MPIDLTGLLAEDELTELVDADIPRVDLVGKGANGIPRFLIAKQDEDSRGLVSPDLVRELIGKQAAEETSGRERVTTPSGLTLSGSPADIAAFIHKAAQRAVDPEKEAAVAVVAKDAGPELDGSGMDPAVPLAAPDGDAPGDPADPGSPAWEAIDAATARKWTSIAVRLRNALCVMAEREMLEAASADPGDAENAFDLEDAQCALDYVIDTLAGFAVGEQGEADLSGEAMAAIGKALAGFDPAPLDVLEGLAPVAKAGRVLSTANEGLIREAAANLNRVLSSLPQAPATDDGQPVAKEQENRMAVSTAEPVTDPGAEPVAKEGVAPSGPVAVADGGTLQATPETVQAIEAVAGTISKADGEKTPMCVVYDQKGRLMGIVAPDDITPVANAEADPEDAGDDTPADPAASAADDMTPAPAAEAGTPADAVPDDGAVTKQDSTGDVFSALESAVTKAVAAALGERTPAEDVAKQADVAGLLEEVETLKARLATVEEQPAAPKVFTNGAVPPANQMRGQDAGAGRQVDVTKARERKAELYAADAPDQARIAKEMQGDAIAYLEALHAAR